MTTKANELVIQSLSSLVSEKRQRVQMLGMTNVSSNEAERMRQSMALSQAQSDLWNAEAALRAAIAKEKRG